MKPIPIPNSSSTNLVPQPVLITGAGGMLGWDLTETFQKELPPNSVIALTHKDLDISNRIEVRQCLSEFRPQLVLNAAAYTDVDGAEDQRPLAYAVNAKGPAFLAQACRDLKARFVHFSTDQVFDGVGKRAWRETDSPRPANYYAETKLLGEMAALKYTAYLVLRVQWLYGMRKNRFTSLKEKSRFTPFSDQYGAPMWTRHIAQVVLALIQREASGLYHLSYDDYASWAEVFHFVKEQWKLDIKLEPQPTHRAGLAAERPRFAVLCNEKLKETLGVAGLGSWRDAMKEFLSEPT